MLYISDCMLFHKLELIGRFINSKWHLTIGSGHKRLTGRDSAVRDPRLFEALVNFNDCDAVLRGDSKISQPTAVLLQVVRNLALASPDAVYQKPGRCMYAEGVCGKGVGCIVGQGLQIMGINAARFDGISMPASGVLGRLGWSRFCQDAIKIGRIQKSQDQNVPWGKCI